LPAHERTWRHPSEIGRAIWVHAEDPPIAIGRGLLVTTGAIGGLLSLAVLWAMLPSAGRGGIASPTVVVSTANDTPTAVITPRPETLVATSLVERLPTTLGGTATTPASDNDVPTQQSPSTTLPGPQTSETATQSAELTLAPVAVAIGDSMVITTARAVRGRTSLTLTDADGNQHDATVLMVDTHRGLAVLSAEAASMTSSYGIGPAASPGDVVTVVGSTTTSANVGVDAAGHLTLDAWAKSTPEGAPILNAAGQLVGICSHSASGYEVISVENVGNMLPPAKPPKPTPWLGVKVTEGDDDVLTVTWLDPEGPAATVGLVLGDVISAVDGAPVSTPEEMKAAIAAYAPGDVVNVTVTHADLTIVEVPITLVDAPSM
jgi:S1-C subfamily serine protease